MQFLQKNFHLRKCIIESHGYSCRSVDAESPMERLRAVVPRAETDTPASEHFGEVMRMDAVDNEAEATVRRAGVRARL